MNVFNAILTGASEGASKYLKAAQWFVVGLGVLLFLLIVRDVLGFFKSSK